MVMGRPREHDRKQIAQDLIEWAKQPDSINFNKFAAYYEPIFPVSKLRAWASECDDFRSAYECAKNFLAFRREEWLNKGTLHVKAFDLNATVYDLQHKDDKIETAEREAKIKANALKSEAQANAQFTKEVCTAVLRGKKAIK
jgi:hypothetical protein